MTCADCEERTARAGGDLCDRCAFNLAVAVAEGVYQLGRLLARHAAFDQWLREHERAAA